jgi:hypothetical protein
MFRPIILSGALLLLAAGIAGAATLGTPVVGPGPGRIIQCVATNLGTSPADASIELFDPAGGAVVPVSDGCAVASPLTARASCAATALSGQVVGCIVRSRSKHVRAALEVFDGLDLVTAVPATSR